MDSREWRKPFQVVLAIAALLIIAATLTLRTVAHPAVLQPSSDNPTPLGYTWSLLLFIIPIGALGWWFASRPDLKFPRAAFWRTIAVPRFNRRRCCLSKIVLRRVRRIPVVLYLPYLCVLYPLGGFFKTAQSFINWRAFSFTFFLLLMISLLWEVTLALPYGWWRYRDEAMIGRSVRGPNCPSKRRASGWR